jgi:ATP-dependent exoDNAse (exonuclease V) alpha subunit
LTYTDDQVAALRMIVGFIRDESARPRVARLTGYAGTGKTMMVGEIAAIVQDMGRQCVILTPTGKAALRVSEATGQPASTIHRFLYRPMQDAETGDVSFVPRGPDDVGDSPSLVIVDESSMLGRIVWEHLRTLADQIGFGILLVGDPFQLEPVEFGDGKPFSFLNIPVAAHAHMTEIVRQRRDHPIIRASMLIREGTGPGCVTDALGLLERVGFRETPASIRAAEGDPVLVYTNKLRHEINREVRGCLGRPDGEIQPGEPLLVLKNNYVVNRYNGELVTLEGWDVPPLDDEAVAVLDRKTKESMYCRYGVARIEGARAVVCVEEIEGRTLGKVGDFWIARGARAAWPALLRRMAEQPDERLPHLHASLGYALTVHKSQGSEFPSVVLALEPGTMSGTLSSRRFLYTAITRGKERVRWTTA